MSNWKRFDIVTRDKDVSERNANLGLEGDNEEMLCSCWVDLEDVSAFYESLIYFKRDYLHATVVALKGGTVLGLVIHINDFEKLKLGT